MQVPEIGSTLELLTYLATGVGMGWLASLLLGFIPAFVDWQSPQKPLVVFAVMALVGVAATLALNLVSKDVLDKLSPYVATLYMAYKAWSGSQDSFALRKTIAKERALQGFKQ